MLDIFLDFTDFDIGENVEIYNFLYRISELHKTLRSKSRAPCNKRALWSQSLQSSFCSSCCWEETNTLQTNLDRSFHWR